MKSKTFFISISIPIPIQGEDYLAENFSARSGGKFSESTKNQIFGANMCKTLIQDLLTLFPPGNMCKFGAIA